MSSTEGPGPAVQYSDTWLDTFLLDSPPATTGAEIAFLERHLPAAQWPTVLDLCCGAGRHAHGLTRAGHIVVGVDHDVRILMAASAGSGTIVPQRLAHRTSDANDPRYDAQPPHRAPYFVAADLRALPLKGPFDAALIMWQSFGWSDETGNRRILRDIHAILREGGRFILDIYDRRFFESRSGERSREVGGLTVTERKRLDGNRLHVELRYGGSDAVDRFHWQIFTPDEIIDEAASAGFGMALCCAKFDEGVPADGSAPRMQLVFEA